MAHAMAHDVTLETATDVEFIASLESAHYLLRVIDGQSLWYPLPKECTPERRMGFARIACVCTRLRLPEPDWPVVM